VTGKNYFKTTLLLAVMSGLLLGIGALLGGNWITIALVLAIAMNGFAYFFSDKIAIRAAGAVPVSEAEFPQLHQIVRGLAAKADMPMPRLYVSPSPQPNAFATGRNPTHAAVVVTQGILPILDRRELEGVLAHELSHVRNRDILISSVAATIGAVITWVAQLAFFFGGGDDEDGGNPIAALLMLLLAPIAATITQLAISRSREFGADSTGARITADPLALASALRKIETYSRGTPPATTNPSTAHLFISNPFKGGAGVTRLFSTHPSTAERVERLERMAASVPPSHRRSPQPGLAAQAGPRLGGW
jgi:heat shock protein HtpX